MKLASSFCAIFVGILLLGFHPLQAQLQNPIIYVTVVPTPFDSATQTAAFGSQQAGAYNAPRGGDLMIRYPDGSVKNITAAAGYGMSGQQGANAIAVREPSVHWSGTKVIFSMIVGAPISANDQTKFYWQIYEVTGVGKTETPVITKLPNQPQNYNNVSPIYGTDERIIFTSDRPREGMAHLYPLLDEYKGEETNTGLWSLDASNGDLFQLDHSPSGDFSPYLDSYGRLLFIRWDHMQRDHQADVDIMQSGTNGSFNYTDESTNATPQYLQRTELFPEPQGIRTDLLNGTNMTGFEFNIFLPWAINEDGSNAEVMNHLGRHDFRQIINRNITDDPNVVVFNSTSTPRGNPNPITNLMQIKEDPTNRGTYYAIDANQNSTHGGGQIIRFNGAPTLDPNETMVSYLTHRSTSMFTFEGNTPNTNHSGFYRNPVPTSDGKLIASHSVNTFADKNLGSATQPLSRYDFRLKFIQQSGSVWTAGNTITNGTTKSLTWWQNGSQVSFNGTLWEVDAVELVARTKPQRRSYNLSSVEQSVFNEEKVDAAKFQAYLKKNNMAVIISRDITQRDKFDKQQPFYLRVAGTTKQSANATGKIYDVSNLQIMQGDHIRGYGMTTAQSTPKAGRRIIAQPMHDATNTNDNGAPIGSVKIAADGSYAAFVPARRALSWQLLNPQGAPVVRERYWVTFKAGEVRVCASCHGNNGEATTPQNPIPQNKPEAFRSLLRQWRSANLPAKVQLQLPLNQANTVSFPATLQWQAVSGALQYAVTVKTMLNNVPTVVYSGTVNAPATKLDITKQMLSNSTTTTFSWSVQAIGEWGDADASDEWTFSLKTADIQQVALRSPLNDSTGVPVTYRLQWQPVTDAISYHLQLHKADNNTVVIENTSSTTQFDFSKLAYGTKYTWQVQAITQAGAGPWSSVWNFTTEVLEPLQNVALRSPADKSEKQPLSVILSWDSVKNATEYTVQLCTSADFITLTDSRVVNNTSQAFTVQPNTVYYWKVQAANKLQNTAWSEVWSFSTETLTAVEEDGFPDVQLLPNPVFNQSLLSFTLPEQSFCLVRVIDVHGGEVLRVFQGIANGIVRLPLQLDALPQGMYSVQIRYAHREIRKKFILVR